MFRRILVPLDGSPLAECALPYARTLARSTGAAISLVHAAYIPHSAHLDGPSPLQTVTTAERYLEEIARACEGEGLRVETDVPPGDPQEAVLETLHRTRPDLVALPLPVHAGLGHWVAVAESVLSESAQPTLLVPTWGTTTNGSDLERAPRVIVPLDGSPTAEAALPFASALAQRLGGELVLLRVVSPVPAIMLSGPGPYLRLDEVVIEHSHNAQRYLGRIAASLRRDGCPATVEVRIGWPADIIAEVAREYRAAFVLLATPWREDDGRARLGGVTRGVLRHGGVPVLLVRASAAHTAGATRERFAEIARATVPAPPQGTNRPVPTGTGLPAAPVVIAPGAEWRGVGALLTRLWSESTGHDEGDKRPAHRPAIGDLLRPTPVLA